MIRIRFQGRGGQGAKTAARILGTAAFLEGFTAQDSPLYGAERRGAPVSAFVRLAHGPIFERGLIAHPDLVLVADETLLAHQAARVLEGVQNETTVFINSSRTAQALTADEACPGRVIALDVTGLALARLGKGGALSAALGAVAARLVGLKEAGVRSAVEQELREVGLSDSTIEQNLALALECFQLVPAAPLAESAPAETPPAPLWTPQYEIPGRGSARITAQANAPLRGTGDWRTFRPVLDPEKCNGCWLCFAYCPDGAIRMDRQDKPVFDYDHCKGCLLCVEECPTHALIVERETAGPSRKETA
nr:2-oxoacid:acceptor oxidoreductase family protein [Nitrospirota bacterium]